ncbi:hypothetical protein MBRA1_003599 [Malassezia brasiliensis]|uniref:Uncharacterized protein n=1 Tax=Malassezia brasiliensis TaxID=1821822 RepID=A0AAF0IUG8_9BASI|nr:hypothetical protein MBRA1_003599 [Malassezia brasiliensis]
MPLFVLSPASLAHSALFAGYYSYLSANVVALRKKDGQVDSAKAVAPGTALHRAVRAHANFAEYTPFAFVLLFLAELNGAPTKYVHAGYVALFASRVAAGVGLNCTKPGNALRVFGFVGTIVVMVGTGLYNFGLGYEPLKSFLGIQ